MKRLTSMFAYPRQDLVAGTVVFLVALPLCLGIAVACAVPPFSGLVAGIVGGLVVPFLSRAPLSVTGPAAGLTTVVLIEVPHLGGLGAFLCATVAAGVLQVALGLLRTGRFTTIIPSAVIKGMLAAIGITIVLRQLPVLLGSSGGLRTLAEHFTPGAAVIGIVSLAIISGWEYTRWARFQALSPALVAVMLGTVLAIAGQGVPSLALSPAQFVHVPLGTVRELLGALPRPQFSGLTEPHVWRVAATIAAVASLETLLSLQAIDRLDPENRKSPADRELVAQGIANMVSGTLGGLPVTAVIARSGANVAAGGRERMSALVHGVLLAASVLFAGAMLNRIPLAALAAVLIRIGLKLCPPSLLRDQFRLGSNQLAPFVITLVAILLTDLMEGVAVGIIVGMVFIVRQNVTGAIVQERRADGVHYLRFLRDGTFLAKPSLLAALDTIDDGESVVIDATDEYLDFDVREALALFMIDARHRHVRVELRGIDLSGELAIADSSSAAPRRAGSISPVPGQGLGEMM